MNSLNENDKKMLAEIKEIIQREDTDAKQDFEDIKKIFDKYSKRAAS